MEIRYVEWIDSSSLTGWMDAAIAETCGMDRCSSVGFVRKETDEYVVLMQSHTNRTDHADQHGDLIAIPKVAITKSRTLRKAT